MHMCVNETKEKGVVGVCLPVLACLMLLCDCGATTPSDSIDRSNVYI